MFYIIYLYKNISTQKQRIAFLFYKYQFYLNLDLVLSSNYIGKCTYKKDDPHVTQRYS